MKWLDKVAVALLVAMLIAILLLVITHDAEAAQSKSKCDPVLTTTKGAHDRAQKGWNSNKLKKSHEAIARVREQARCVPDGKPRHYVKTQIRKAKKQFKQEPDRMYDEITSSPGQDRLARLRWCESGNRYNDPSAPAGAYGMLHGWAESQRYYTSKMKRAFGTPTSPPYTTAPVIQDVLASLLYQHGGWWECPF